MFFKLKRPDHYWFPTSFKLENGDKVYWPIIPRTYWSRYLSPFQTQHTLLGDKGEIWRSSKPWLTTRSGRPLVFINAEEATEWVNHQLLSNLELLTDYMNNKNCYLPQVFWYVLLDLYFKSSKKYTCSPKLLSFKAKQELLSLEDYLKITEEQFNNSNWDSLLQQSIKEYKCLCILEEI